MLFRKTGEASPSSTCATGGNTWSTTTLKSTRSVPLRLEQATVATPSSELLLYMVRPIPDACISWIQGHPEFGFGFKALVCHDGVFDARFVGFYTDELFFVSLLPFFVSLTVLIALPCSPITSSADVPGTMMLKTSTRSMTL